MCVDTSGTWIAAGFSAGIFSAIDIRAGILRGQARIHDGEISQVLNVFFLKGFPDVSLLPLLRI